MSDLERFWELIKPYKGYVEIRLVPINKQLDKFFWNNLRELQKTLSKEVIVNKYVSFFVKKYEDVEKILNYKDQYFSKNTKICYGINERFKNKNKNNINGKYESLKYYKLIIFDVDKKDHSNIMKWEEKYLESYVKDITEYLKNYYLDEPTLIISGAGIHIIYIVDNIKITDARRRGYKEWGEGIKEFFKHDMFVMDPLFDATRILGLPGSTNVKRGRQVKILKLSDKINKKFKIKSKKVPKAIPTQKFEGTEKEAVRKILNNKMVKILITKKLPDAGNTNNILIFQLKILLRIHNFTEDHPFVRKLFARIQQVQQDIYPSNFPKGELFFNRNHVNSYFEELGLEKIYKTKNSSKEQNEVKQNGTRKPRPV